MPSAACVRSSSAFPDGKYGFHDIIENDGIEAKPYTVAIDLYVQGDELVADYSRSSPQARGPVSATLGVATGAVYNGILHITDPTIPKNSGCFRPIRVVSPPGRVTNVDYPNPLVAGNTETHPRLANIVIGAMASCVPERAMASESCTGTNFVFGGNHPRTTTMPQVALPRAAATSIAVEHDPQRLPDRRAARTAATSATAFAISSSSDRAASSGDRVALASSRSTRSATTARSTTAFGRSPITPASTVASYTSPTASGS